MYVIFMFLTPFAVLAAEDVRFFYGLYQVSAATKPYTTQRRPESFLQHACLQPKETSHVIDYARILHLFTSTYHPGLPWSQTAGVH